MVLPSFLYSSSSKCKANGGLLKYHCSTTRKDINFLIIFSLYESTSNPVCLDSNKANLQPIFQKTKTESRDSSGAKSGKELEGAFSLAPPLIQKWPAFSDVIAAGTPQ